MTNRYKDMTNKELAAYLKEYADERGGEISDLTREASNRIAALDAKLRRMEDDRK